MECRGDREDQWDAERAEAIFLREALGVFRITEMREGMSNW